MKWWWVDIQTYYLPVMVLRHSRGRVYWLLLKLPSYTYISSLYIRTIQGKQNLKNLNFSGDDNHRIVSNSIQLMNEDRERETIRLCLKHFRKVWLYKFFRLSTTFCDRLVNFITKKYHVSNRRDGTLTNYAKVLLRHLFCWLKNIASL